MIFFLAAALGVLIAFILALPAVLLEVDHRVKNAPLIIDVTMWRGVKLTSREAFAFGLLLHLVIGGLYGLFYTIFAHNDWLVVTNAPYTLHSMLIFAFASWLVLGNFLLPLIGLGWFGRKEGSTVWMETLISLLLEGLVLWEVIKWYQPFFFG